jgi:hypothetical protein
VLTVRCYLPTDCLIATWKNCSPSGGITVDHVSVFRWVQRFTPLLIDAAQPCRYTPGDPRFVERPTSRSSVDGATRIGRSTSSEALLRRRILADGQTGAPPVTATGPGDVPRRCGWCVACGSQPCRVAHPGPVISAGAAQTHLAASHRSYGGRSYRALGVLVCPRMMGGGRKRVSRCVGELVS